MRHDLQHPSEAAASSRLEPKSPSTEAAGRRRLVLAGVAGNAMEWHDFAVYGYFSAMLGLRLVQGVSVGGENRRLGRVLRRGGGTEPAGLMGR
jgi:hypothetical protein